MTLASDSSPVRPTLPVVQIHHDHDRLKVDESVVQSLVERTVSAYPHVDGPFLEIGIILSNRESVHELNRTYLDHDYPTDVLSFFVSDEPPFEGEVYIDLDTAMERCVEFGSSFQLEAYRYIVHGVLHLMGMNDGNTTEKAAMHVAEDVILDTLTD